MVETRTSMFCAVGLQIDAAVLRQAALRDVHVRHDFEARDDRRLQQTQLRRHRDFMQDAIDAITNAQIVLQRLDVNVRRAFHDRFANDLVDELHDRRFRIVRVQIRARLDILTASNERFVFRISSNVSAPTP